MKTIHAVIASLAVLTIAAVALAAPDAEPWRSICEQRRHDGGAIDWPDASFTVTCIR